MEVKELAKCSTHRVKASMELKSNSNRINRAIRILTRAQISCQIIATQAALKPIKLVALPINNSLITYSGSNKLNITKEII